MSKKQTKNILPESVQEVLTNESLQLIEQEVNSKINLAVESALAQQDELYATRLNTLIEAIDKDHTKKLKKIVEAVDRSNATKLKKVISKFNNEINNSAKEFKDTLVESISNYLELYIDEAVPAAAILEATKNRTATEILTNLRKVLGIDSSFVNESIKPALIDGKNKIEALEKQVQQLEKENSFLKESYIKTKSNLLLETKTANLPDKKKEFMKRVLGDKSPSFIEENFDYTLRLFDKKESQTTEILKEQALTNRTVKTDAPRVIIENTNKKQTNPYVAELQRMR